MEGSLAFQYPITTNKVITNPFEGLVLGNGDLAANVVINSHELIFLLGKNDLWDSRVDNLSAEQALKHDDLIRYERDYNFEWPEDCTKLPQTYAEWEGNTENLSIIYESNAIQKEIDGCLFLDWGGAAPRRAGQLRILHPGLSDTKISASLDISRGLLTVVYDMGGGAITVDAFIRRKENALSLRITARGQVPWVKLYLEKLPDYSDATTPLPQAALRGNYFGTLTQEIPAGCDVDQFCWHLAGAFPMPGQGAKVTPLMQMSYAFHQTVRPKDGESVIFSLGIATDRDSGIDDPLERAVTMAEQGALLPFEEQLHKQEKEWEEFWSASSIQLADKELESVWYRSMYGFACHLAPGALGPGLVSNLPMNDYSAFHGYYTWNHNVQKWYAPALAVNHTEWYEVFADLLELSMPTFEYFSNTIFGLDGIYCDLSSIPFTPPFRANVNNKWGRSLAVIGWLAHMLWQHWAYTRDKQWLEKRAYRFIQQTAVFYAGYIEKYMDESGDIYPSMRLEEPGWCHDFIGNRNVSTDLCMFRLALENALDASEVLGVDDELRNRWKLALARVPEMEYGWTDDGQGWYALCRDWSKVDSVIDGRRLIDFADVDWRINYARSARWGGGGWPVYPGEYVMGDEEGGLAEAIRDMLRRTDTMNPPNTMCKIHAISSLIPLIRLGLREKYEDIRALLLSHRYDSGQFASYSVGEGELVRGVETWRIEENQFQGILCITEMLLQSQGGILRFFPFLPEGQDARFCGLRSMGGFVVSAATDGKGSLEAVVESVAGEPCRIRWLHENPPVVLCGGEPVSCILRDQELRFDTKPGGRYAINY